MDYPKQPRYFHLLWDDDLDELRDVLQRIRDRRGEVVSHWYELYLLHFGDDRTLSQSDFRRIFEPALLRNQEALLRKDMDAYAASVLRTGSELAERHVPLDELIAAVQLFEDAAQAVFPCDPAPPISVYNKFDKLSHIRIILLVAAYSRLQSASAATRINALELEARNLPADKRSRFHGLVGHSAAMREIYGKIEEHARSGASLLIVGEPGSGKELTARAVHECTRGRRGPFVALRCEAMPAYMIEAELFGYQRPEPNSHRYLGLYGAALGGSLFIDEICSLPLDVQETLAECSRRGGEVRIMASSSRDPEPALRVGQLRKDFIGLFSGRRLQIPPLRERRGDIALLVRHFIDLLNHRTAHEPAIAGIDDHALELMERYAWPGNVRELYEAIETAFCGARSDIIGAADLPAWLSGIDGPGKRLPTIAFETFADAERAVLERALEITGGNKLRAARLLKISRKKLYSGIAKYGIRPVETRSAVR